MLILVSQVGDYIAILLKQVKQNLLLNHPQLVLFRHIYELFKQRQELVVLPVSLYHRYHVQVHCFRVLTVVANLLVLLQKRVQ